MSQDYYSVRDALAKRVAALSATKTELYAVPWSSESTAALYLSLKMRILREPEFEIAWQAPPHGCASWEQLALELDKYLTREQGFDVSYWPSGIRINYHSP
jgi:hypothetical protein